MHTKQALLKVIILATVMSTLCAMDPGSRALVALAEWQDPTPMVDASMISCDQNIGLNLDENAIAHAECETLYTIPARDSILLELLEEKSQETQILQLEQLPIASEMESNALVKHYLSVLAKLANPYTENADLQNGRLFTQADRYALQCFLRHKTSPVRALEWHTTENGIDTATFQDSVNLTQKDIIQLINRKALLMHIRAYDQKIFFAPKIGSKSYLLSAETSTILDGILNHYKRYSDLERQGKIHYIDAKTEVGFNPAHFYTPSYGPRHIISGKMLRDMYKRWYQLSSKEKNPINEYKFYRFDRDPGIQKLFAPVPAVYETFRKQFSNEFDRLVHDVSGLGTRPGWPIGAPVYALPHAGD